MGRLTDGVYRFIRFWVKLFYPKIQVFGLENLPKEPCVIVSNHCQMNGPISAELYFPGERAIWCAGEMMDLKAVPDYAFRDFWRNKPRSIRWFYRLLSYLIAPFSVCIFKNARTIPVYRDKRLLTTFRQTIARLKAGANVIIFPEYDAPHNHILCDFQEGFVDVARSYCRQSGKPLAFVPMYLAPSRKAMYIGEPVFFSQEAPIREERARICACLKGRITAMAVALPRHRVVPYNNMPKKNYGYNVPEEAPYETARG